MSTMTNTTVHHIVTNDLPTRRERREAEEATLRLTPRGEIVFAALAIVGAAVVGRLVGFVVGRAIGQAIVKASSK